MNDWAIILGASSGIGAACAKALAQQGLNIYGLYLRKKQTEIDKLTWRTRWVGLRKLNARRIRP